jgi:hypothetical protein
VESLYDTALTRFVRAADRLAVEGTAQTWATARSAAEQLSRAAVIRSLVAREETDQELARLSPVIDLLEQAYAVDREATTVLEGIDALTPAEAFETGRRFERDRESGRTVRSEFLTRWAKTRRKLGR